MPFRLVLLRPRNPENLGAVARAMKNFGLSDWAIVDPGTQDFATARRVAVHSEELLDQLRLVATLDEAVADCAWVVGTSSRQVRGKRRLLPAEVAREAAERAGAGRTAVVFGDERSGLTSEEIDRCHDLSVIPSLGEQPSLNLAQAALVYCYEGRAAAARDRTPPLLPAAASDGELCLLSESLRTVLREGGFLAGPERHAVKDLVAPLRRSRLTAKEVRLWIAALKKVRGGK